MGKPVQRWLFFPSQYHKLYMNMDCVSASASNFNYLKNIDIDSQHLNYEISSIPRELGEPLETKIKEKVKFYYKFN